MHVAAVVVVVDLRRGRQIQRDVRTAHRCLQGWGTGAAERVPGIIIVVLLASVGTSKGIVESETFEKQTI